MAPSRDVFEVSAAFWADLCLANAEVEVEGCAMIIYVECLYVIEIGGDTTVPISGGELCLCLWVNCEWCVGWSCWIWSLVGGVLVASVTAVNNDVVQSY